MKPYYRKDGITIYHGDCRQHLDDHCQKFDLCITSPPYNKYEVGAEVHIPTTSGMWKRSKLPVANGGYFDALHHTDYLNLMRSVFVKCWDLLNEKGAAYVVHKPRQLGNCVRWPTEVIPLPVRQVIIWDRCGGINFNRSFYQPRQEWILVCAKPKHRLKDRSASGVGDVWRIAPVQASGHPAPFPVEIPARILTATDAQTVFDPFMGSGTTLVAAKQLGRRAIGIELEKRWCKLAAERLEAIKA
jgi:modification methylase